MVVGQFDAMFETRIARVYLFEKGSNFDFRYFSRSYKPLLGAEVFGQTNNPIGLLTTLSIEPNCKGTIPPPSAIIDKVWLFDIIAGYSGVVCQRDLHILTAIATN